MSEPSIEFLFAEMARASGKVSVPDTVTEEHFEEQKCSCGNTSKDGITIHSPHAVVLCEDCGHIFQERNICEEAEWNNYKSPHGVSQNKSRCNTGASPDNPYDDGHNVQYPKGVCVSTFTTPDGKKIQYDMSRRNVWNIPHKQKAFWDVSNILARGAERLGSPKCILDHAKSIWYEVTRKGVVIRGGIRQGIIANCLAYACRLADAPREDSEIAQAFQIDTKNLTKGHKVLKEMFAGTEHEYILYKGTKESSKFAKFVSYLDLPFKIGKRCEQIYDKYDDEMSSIAPKSRVAGILAYVVSDSKLAKPTQKEICKAIKVCPPTLKKVFNILKSLEE